MLRGERANLDQIEAVMDQTTNQILIVIFMVAFGVWWQNRDLPKSVWVFGDEPPEITEAVGPKAR